MKLPPGPAARGAQKRDTRNLELSFINVHDYRHSVHTKDHILGLPICFHLGLAAVLVSLSATLTSSSRSTPPILMTISWRLSTLGLQGW